MLTLETAIQKIHQFSPEQRNKVIEFIEFIDFLDTQARQPEPPLSSAPSAQSFTEAAHEFIGCLDSDIDDLSHNPKYLEGFGQ